MRLDNKKIVFISPLRFDINAAMNRTVDADREDIPIVQAINLQQGKSLVMHDYRNVTVLASTKNLKKLKWGMVVKIDKSEAYKPIYTLRNLLVILVLFVMLVSTIASCWMSRKFVRPIDLLKHAVERISNGNYTQKVEIHSKDETGIFAQGFNNMMKMLEHAHQTLNNKVIQLANEVKVREAAEIKLKTYQEQLEHQVKTRTRELEASNEELKSFNYSISHDIRAPLRAINGFSLALREDNYEALNKEGKHNLDRISANVIRMDELTNGLIRLSRVSYEKIEFIKINISHICEKIVANLKETLINKTTEIEIEKNMYCTGDPDLIRVVLENLIGNSWKYSSNRNLIHIKIYSKIMENKTRAFIFEDKGVGFDMQLAKNIFEPFHRYHGNEFEGSGIGLATVKRIITRHGGEIWATSTPNEGATFSFTLNSTYN